jgi:hypothetical protein
MSPVTKGLSVLAGKPTMDLAGMVANTLTVGVDVSLELAHHLRKVDALRKESGLTYLVELHRAVDST